VASVLQRPLENFGNRAKLFPSIVIASTKAKQQASKRDIDPSGSFRST